MVQGHDLLRKRLNKQNIFLAIDNVCTSESSVQSTHKLLSLGLNERSIILVTACTHEDLLEVIGYDLFGKCLPLPNLAEEEAIDILLHRAIPNCDFACLPYFHQQFIRHCTSLCKKKITIQMDSNTNGGSIMRFQYHPSSLIKMGAELGGNSNIWISKLLNLLKNSKQNHVNGLYFIAGKHYEASNTLREIQWELVPWRNYDYKHSAQISLQDICKYIPCIWQIVK
ncbi:hypothetical protein SUGI_0710870 [Cryptomeria japonica]|nr:hypothetical protein SUGI_0710870 [Cryptomeria japonica]